MHKVWGALVVAIVCVSVAMAVGFTAVADDDDDDDDERKQRSFRANLSGYQEVPTLSMPGSGSLRLRLNSGATEATYTLSYSGLSGDALFAHIHLGARGTNGGVIVFLCDAPGGAPAPAGTPACPGASGIVSGSLNAASVVGPAAQGIAAGEWTEFVAALRAGFTYANAHTTLFPGGEIRGQVSSS